MKEKERKSERSERLKEMERKKKKGKKERKRVKRKKKRKVRKRRIAGFILHIISSLSRNKIFIIVLLLAYPHTLFPVSAVDLAQKHDQNTEVETEN